MNTVEKVNYYKVLKYSEEKIKPCLFEVDKTIYSVDSFGDCIKIMLYSLYNKEIIKDYVEENLGQKCIVFKKEVFFRRKKYDIYYDTVVVFSQKYYFKLYYKELLNFYTLSIIAKRFKLPKDDYILYIYDETKNEDEIKEEKDKICKKPKSGKYYISKINKEVYSREEITINKIEKAFKKYNLLGDIYLSEEDENDLKIYMKQELNYCLKLKDYTPIRPKVFVYGLINHAKKFYKNNKLWPSFKSEYEIEIPPKIQDNINRIYQREIKYNGKYYEDNANSIQNMALHSFVTDPCADQFFDYLFDYWRLDLNRNIENISNKGMKDILIDEISNIQTTNNVMYHTSLALKYNENGCKKRIHKILRMIDDTYWNKRQYESKTNRITILFNKWIQNKNSTFYKDYNKTYNTKNRKKGDILLSAPILTCDVINKKCAIKFPRQYIKDIETNDKIIKWKVTIGSFELFFETKSIDRKVSSEKKRFYIDDFSGVLPFDKVYGKFFIELLVNDERYVSYTIEENELRLFNQNEKMIDITRGYLQQGNIYCISKNNDMPFIINKEENFNDGYYTILNLEKGDIVVFPNQKIIQVGYKIEEGIIGGQCVDEVLVNEDIKLYNTLPQLLITGEKNSLRSIGIDINTKKYNLTSLNYKEYQFDANINIASGFLVSLNDIIKYDGIYTIDIRYRNVFKQYKICYIKDFNYQFLEAPYIFNEYGRISFSNKMPIHYNNNSSEINEDKWEYSNSNKVYNFNFNEELNDVDKCVKDRKINFNYQFQGQQAKISFPIPAFFWRFNKNDKWSVLPPADILYKDIPSDLFVAGPFDLNKMSIYCENGNEIDDILVDSTNHFSLTEIKNNMSRDEILNRIFIRFDDEINKTFLNVICKSKIIDINISGDIDKNQIYGNVNIEGNGDYVVDVILKTTGKEIITNNEIKKGSRKGQFIVETTIQSGLYTISIYEIEEDENGFGSERIFLGSKDLKLVNVNDLANNLIEFKGIQDIRKKFAVERFNNEKPYIISNFERKEYCNIKEKLIGLSRFDDNDPKIQNAIFYEADLGTIINLTFYKKLFQVLVIFYNNCNFNDVIILYKDDSENVVEYNVLLLNSEYNQLIACESNLIRNKYQKIKTLYGNDYTYIIDIIDKEKE